MSLCHDVIIMPHPILINYGLDMAQFIANLHFFLQETGHDSNILCNFATKI
jgi:hypothetical protein